jgi:hypothetical protein
VNFPNEQAALKAMYLGHFFGFNPSSWAIRTWVADSRVPTCASAHACSRAAAVFFSRFALYGVRRRVE